MRPLSRSLLLALAAAPLSCRSTDLGADPDESSEAARESVQLAETRAAVDSAFHQMVAALPTDLRQKGAAFALAVQADDVRVVWEDAERMTSFLDRELEGQPLAASFPQARQAAAGLLETALSENNACYVNLYPWLDAIVDATEIAAEEAGLKLVPDTQLARIAGAAGLAPSQLFEPRNAARASEAAAAVGQPLEGLVVARINGSDLTDGAGELGLSYEYRSLKDDIGAKGSSVFPIEIRDLDLLSATQVFFEGLLLTPRMIRNWFGDKGPGGSGAGTGTIGTEN